MLSEALGVGTDGGPANVQVILSQIIFSKPTRVQTHRAVLVRVTTIPCAVVEVRMKI